MIVGPVNSTKARTAASLILRGPNDFYCDEMERSVHDALCVVKRVMESKSLVPGGGAVETALSIYLENFATSLVSCCSSTSAAINRVCSCACKFDFISFTTCTYYSYSAKFEEKKCLQ